MTKPLREHLLSIGETEGEPENRRAVRRIVVGSMWFSAVGIPISSTFEWLDGFPWLAAVGYVQGLAALGALGLIHLWPHRMVWWIQSMLVVFAGSEFAEIWMRGGLVGSGGAAMWGMIGVLLSLIAISIRAAGFWFLILIAEVVASVVLANSLETDPLYPNFDPTIDLATTLVLVSVVTFAVLAYFVRQRDRLQEQSDQLLRNVLPDSIATRLKRDETIADEFDNVTVLFADVVGFTPLSKEMSPDALVSLLGDLFADLDAIVGELGLEKIKTVGDEYMVAAGVPEPRPDHAVAVAEFAVRVQELLQHRTYDGRSLQFRMGIHTGPVVAGVIGQRKFAYDLWGDTVNTASRLESHGVPGRIQLSEATRRLIDDAYQCEPRGTIELKGRGDMTTWFLAGRRARSTPEPTKRSRPTRANRSNPPIP